MRYFLEKLAFAPEDGTGGGAADDAAGNDQQQQQAGDGDQQQQQAADDKAGEQTRAQQARAKGLFPAGDQQSQQQQQQQQAETPADGRPEGLPDKFWNAKDKAVNVDALAKAFKDTETKLHQLTRQKSVGGEVPENEADYFAQPIELPDTVTRAKLEPDDPGLKAWAAACKKHGIGKDMARALAVDMFVSMNDFMPEPMDPEAERAALGKEGPAMADGLWGWADNMERSGAMNGDDVDVFESLMGSAKGMRFLAKVRGMTGLEPIPMNVGEGAGSMSPAEWQQAYSAAVKAGDYAEQARLDKIGEAINGTHAAGSSRGGSIGFAG